MINELILIFIIQTPLWQKSPAGSFISTCIALVFGAFWILDPYLNDVGYYIGAALFDLLLVYLIGAVRPVSLFAIILQRLCIASICVNALGFVMYELYMPATVYNGLITAVHAYMALCLWRGDHNGTITAGGRADSIYFNFRSGLLSARQGL